MYRSLEKLREANIERIQSAPLASAVGTVRLVPAATLEGIRQRNAFLDWLFYDIGKLTDEEAREVSPWLAAEGALLFVPPSDSGPLRRFASIDAFAKSDGSKACTLVVAGVGSSALGSAALARNVADAIQAPVVAVVSGYGLADVAAEALGGFVWFGALNSVRHSFEWLDRLRESGVIADPSLSAGLSNNLSTWQSKDTRSVQALLSHPDLSFNLLVGHSKGNLVLSEALFTLDHVDHPRLREIGEKTCIVTLSAKIAMPPACRHVVDVMGQLDAFGVFNSRPDIPTDVTVPGAWHHTNTDLPWHLPVTSVLADLHRGGQIRIH
jgi:hypothetical protein